MTEEEKIQESNEFFQRLKENDRKAEERKQEFERNLVDIEVFINKLANFVIFGILFIGFIAGVSLTALFNWIF